MRFASTILITAAIALAASIGIRAAAQEPIRPAPAARPQSSGLSGAELFKAACSTCHGIDGKGNPKSRVGFDFPLPDFTDCAAATPEFEKDWFAVIYNGGPIRGFDRHMPSFGQALAEEDIHKLVAHLRSFCADEAWPHGEMNLPRPLVTEKAFPENEWIYTLSVSKAGGAAFGNDFQYEHRIGARAGYEFTVPIEFQHSAGESYSRGLGDVAVAFKNVLFQTPAHGTMVSIAEEIAFPTGKETLGLGSGTTTFETYGAYAQVLPREAFLQAQGGFGLPTDTSKEARYVFWRGVGGWSFTPHRFGREISPMLELVGQKDLRTGESPQWNLVPEAQVTLSKLQHIRFAAGLQLPLNNRQSQSRVFMTYLLWDWFDGPFFSHW